MKKSTKAAGGRQLRHKDMERKQPPMTTSFAPLVAVRYGSNPRSSKRPPSTLLGAKPIECKAPSKKRPLQILDKKGDDLLIAKFATKVRGIGSHPPAIIAKSRASSYSSDDDDSLCLAHLVAATKAKKENKAKELKPEACRSETKKHVNTKSRLIVSTESTVFLEQQLTSVQVPLPMLNDFGVWKAHSKTLINFAKRTKNVKHLRKDRLAKKGPPFTDTSVPLSLRDIGGPNLHADFSKRSTTRETELVTKQLLAVYPGTKIKELTIESFDESSDTLIATTVPPPDEALNDVDSEKKCEDAARLKKVFFVNSNNIAHALLERSIYGPFAQLRPSAVTIDSNAIIDGTETTDDKDTTDNNKKRTSTCYATNQEKLSRTRIPWSIPSWLRLVQHNAGDSGKGKFTSMAWDRWGVLLAVAYESSAASSGNPVVAIYDWDVLVAADRRGRNQQLRWLHNGSTYGRDGAIEMERVEPFMTIPIPSRSRAPVTVLEWNPFRPDELVVGLRSSGSVCIFDLDAVRAWLEGYIQNGRTEGGPLPPCRELRCFEEGPRRLPGNFNGAVIHHDSPTFLFLDDGNHAILSAGNMLFCWCTRGGNWVPGMLNVVWKFQYKEAITSMAVLTSDMIVLGSCSGRLAVLSWKKVVRASFSCKPSPTLVEDRVSFSAGPLQEQLETPSPTSAMAILKLHVIAESTISEKLVIYRLVWVTSCGWVLSSTIEVRSSSTDPKLPSASETLIRRRKGCELYHATKPIRWKDVGGELVGPSKSMWVVPTKQIQVDNTEMALVWQKVEDNVIQVLAHHDQRVLGSAPGLAHPRCMNLKLQWMTMLGSCCGPVTKRYQLRTISIANSAGPMTSIAIHPDQEWIVVGTSQNGIFLVNSRSNIPQLPSVLPVG